MKIDCVACYVKCKHGHTCIAGPNCWADCATALTKFMGLLHHYAFLILMYWEFELITKSIYIIIYCYENSFSTPDIHLIYGYNVEMKPTICSISQTTASDNFRRYKVKQIPNMNKTNSKTFQ